MSDDYDEIQQKSMTWSPRDSAPPHPLMPQLARNYLNNFVKKLDREQLDSLLQPIRSGVLDYSTVLNIQDPTTHENVPVKASDLIAILGAPEGDEQEYDTVIEDDEEGYYEIVADSSPAVKNSPLTQPKLAKSASAKSLSRYTPDPTTCPKPPAPVQAPPQKPPQFEVESGRSEVPLKTRIGYFVCHNKRLIVCGLVVLLILVLIAVIVTVIVVATRGDEGAITVTLRGTSDRIFFQTDSWIGAEFTYDAIDSAILITQKRGRGDYVAVVVKLDPKTLKQKGGNHSIDDLYRCASSGNGLQQATVYSLMGCTADPCKQPTTYKQCTSCTVECYSSDAAGAQVAKTEYNSFRCGIWAFCSKNSQCIYFCAVENDKPCSQMPTPIPKKLKPYETYSIIRERDGMRIQLSNVSSCLPDKCTIRSRSGYWLSSARDQKGDIAFMPGPSMASETSLAVLLDVSHSQVTKESTFETRFVEFSIDNYTVTEIPTRNIAVDKFMQKIPNPWREVRENLLLHKVDSSWLIVAQQNNTLEFVSYDSPKSSTTFDLESVIPTNFTIIGPLAFGNSIYVVSERSDDSGKEYSIAALDVSV